MPAETAICEMDFSLPRTEIPSQLRRVCLLRHQPLPYREDWRGELDIHACGLAWVSGTNTHDGVGAGEAAKDEDGDEETRERAVLFDAGDDVPDQEGHHQVDGRHVSVLIIECWRDGFTGELLRAEDDAGDREEERDERKDAQDYLQAEFHDVSFSPTSTIEADISAARDSKTAFVSPSSVAQTR